MQKLLFTLLLFALPALAAVLPPLTPLTPLTPLPALAATSPLVKGATEEPVAVTATRQEPVQVSQSDGAVIIAVSTSVITLIGVMFNGIMAYLMQKLSAKASRVEEQAAATTKKIDETAETVKVVHSLVNSNMRVALAEALEFAQRLAKLSKKPEDIALALRAHQRLTAHDEGQALADSGVVARKRRRRATDEDKES